MSLFGEYQTVKMLMSGAAFSGAYDGISNIAAAYGMRRLLTSYTSNLLRLRRSSDNVESDFGYDVNGDLDTSAISTWLGGASGYIVTWYDQSGNGYNATQATAGDQPIYVESAANGHSSIRYSANEHLDTTADFDGFTALSIIATISDRSSPNTIVHAPYGDTGSAGPFPFAWYMRRSDGLLAYQVNNNALQDFGNSWLLNDYMIISGRWASGARSMFFNGGTAIATDTLSTTISSTGKYLAIGVRGGGSYFVGDVAELVAINAAVSVADHNAVGQSMDDYYGPTWNDVS